MIEPLPRSHVFLEREWDEPVTSEWLHASLDEASPCFDLHRVRWHESFLSGDSRRVCCHFSAPDAESLRSAFREQYPAYAAAQAPMSGLDGARVFRYWPGTIYEAPGLADADRAAANVVVSRNFDAPVVLSDLQAVEDAHGHCLRLHNVRFVRSYHSLDRRRMVCLYAAPDAESVRTAQRQATMPVDAVWAFRRLLPGEG
ncbi:MAG: nickel-binding protein [Pseudomonadota bacterium]